MIDIMQWRAVTGTFNQIRATQHVHNATEVVQGESDNNSRSDFCYVMVCYAFMYLYVLHCLILYILLILRIDDSLVVIIFVFCGSPFHHTFMEITKVNLGIVFIFLQLLLSGDIETNPGPNVYKDCSVCGKAVHVKSKSC